MARPKRIAVLGGGMGALSFVFELTSKPDWQKEWDVTVYNLGWRLGGKGASGREAPTQRILEHGLHILSGSYDLTWRTMRAAYDELGRAPGEPLATWEEAFKKHRLFVLEDTRDGGKKRFQWVIPFPENGEVPGTVGDRNPWEHLVSALEWVGEQILKHVADGLEPKPPTGQGLAARIEAAFSEKLDDVERLARDVVSSGGTGEALLALTRDVADAAGIPHDFSALHVARGLARAVVGRPEDAAVHSSIAEHARLFRDGLLKRLEGIIETLSDFLYQLVITADIAVATIIGMVADGLVLPPHDWFKVDDRDFRQWLRQWGACEAAVGSAPVRVAYEMIFAQDAGLGAGTALHAMMNLVFEYRGAFSWKMQAGMGDVVFAPLYLVLQKRGVRFEHFQRVDELIPSADGTWVDRIVIGQQAIPDGPYDPLVPVPWGGDPEKTLPSWPSTPVFDRLKDGKELAASGCDLEDFWTRWKDPLPPRVLQCGADFDFVVFGISVGALPFVAPKLLEASRGLQRAATEVKTVQTTAVQLWMDRDLAGLGWKLGSPILGTYREPFTTWADMTQLSTAEDWPTSAGVQNISYLCDEMQDEGPIPPRDQHDYPAIQNARVKAKALEWLEKDATGLWPAAARGGGFDWDVLVDLERGVGPARFDSQYWHAPLNPSERYVLSVPGSVSARLRENQSGFANMLLVGDWIKTSWSAGFLEAATRSGVQAWQALTGATEPDVGLPREPGSFDPDFTPGGQAMVPFDANFVPGLPYSLEGTTMQTFVLEADPAKLAELCNRYLNGPCHGGPGSLIWRPVGPFVAFVAADIARISSNDPPSWTPERDFGFWVPVVGGKVVDDVFHPEVASFFLPYLWVDTALAVTVGREVQGFPKGIGVLGCPTKTGDAAEITVDGYAVKTYSTVPTDDSRWKLRRIVRGARQDEPIWKELEVAWKDLVELSEGLLRALAGLTFGSGGSLEAPLELFGAMVENAVSGKVPMLFLKQYPSVTDTNLAAYQAVVTAPNELRGGIRGAGPIPGDWRFEVTAYDSCKIVEHLGLRLDGGLARSLMQFYVKFDFELGPGRVLCGGTCP